MSLFIYESSGGVGAISQNELFTNPILFTISQSGGILEQRVYLRSDNPETESFADGRIYARDATTPDESNWVEFAADFNGSAGEYTTVLDFIVPLGQEVPIWIKLDVPSGQEIGTKTDISIITDYVTVEA